MQAEIIKVPNIGDFKDVPVIAVHVKKGDTVKLDDPLVTLESDKATMDVPAEKEGVVQEVLIKLNDKVSEGSPMISILPLTAQTDETTKAAKAEAKEVLRETDEEKNPTKGSLKEEKPAEVAGAVEVTEAAKAAEVAEAVAPLEVFASPSVRKLARELDIDLQTAKIQGTGEKGRITDQDLKNRIKSMMQKDATYNPEVLPWPKVDFAKYGPIERKELSRIKLLSGANLARNWALIPHVTQHDQADITELEQFRVDLNSEYQKENLKVTMLAFLIKAVIAALKAFPEFNSSLESKELVYKKYYHIGFAADTKQGLVVPVLKDADKKGLLDIVKETSYLAGLAREGKLKPADMQGGSFTISSLGGIGGQYFTPIINAPEVAILGVSKAVTQAVYQDQTFVPKLMLPLSLSYDHRVIDGALGARFITFLTKILVDPRRLVL